MNNITVSHAGLSSHRLQILTDRIQADIDAKLIPGAAMLIARNGRVGYEQALGIQDPEGGAPMALDTIFRIYSMTKPIVSVATMMLFEEGRFLLSDPVAKWLPELANPKVGVEVDDGCGGKRLELVDALQPITVQDLLRHTSGLSYGFFGESLVKEEYRRLAVGDLRLGSDAYIARLAQAPLAYQPGTVWEYSHSTDALGVLLERATDMPLDRLLSERILQPLRMHETGFSVASQHLHRVAQPFATDPVTGTQVRLNDVSRQPAFLSGGGGMVSTLHDYLRFTQMLCNGGELDGVRLLSRKTLDYMTSDHLAGLPLAKSGQGYLPGPGYGFGLGFGVRTEAGASVMPGSVGDYTWSGLAGTYFWVDPAEDLLGIFMMQAPEQRAHYRQLFRALVYAALE
jgi:CubicO group peptidase (beta-lactamase class C family)